jgi:tetratricopeptide (TPR) repeat protein
VRHFWIYALLAVVTLAVYAPVLSHPFINFDDPDYVTDNVHVRAGLSWDGVVWAFTTTQAANWFPITWLSHMLDWQLFGGQSGWHHFVSLLIHIATTLLLFAVLNRMTGARWRSAFVALIFALHPLHIESVAWVAERKDVLSAFFWMLTLWAYLHYVKRSGAARYLLVAASFCGGLMSKPMVLTLPAVLLLLDVWPLRRFGRKAVIEKLPLFALSVASAVVTYLVQRGGGAVMTLDQVPLGMRLENALVSYAIYLWKVLWPTNLAVFYPYPQLAWWHAAVAGVAIAGISIGAIRRPYLAVGWFWFLVTLVPVIGFVQVGEQARADRYMYIPMIGVAIIIAWGLPELLHRRAAAVIGAVACAAMAVVTLADLKPWRSSELLFRHAIDVTDGNYVAYNNLGNALRSEGRIHEAIPMFENALRIRPRFIDAQNSLAEALLVEGRTDEAMPHLEAALKLAPRSAEVHVNLGAAAMKRGQWKDAEAEYRIALGLAPESATARGGLGAALGEQGRIEEALAELRQSVRLKPEDADARYNLGRWLGIAGHTDEAIAAFSEAVRLQPADAAAHFNLGTALASQNRMVEAIKEFSAAVKLNPGYVNAHFNLGSALASLGRFDEAIEEFSTVLRLQPDFEQARENLEYCRSVRRKAPE